MQLSPCSLLMLDSHSCISQARGQGRDLSPLWDAGFCSKRHIKACLCFRENVQGKSLVSQKKHKPGGVLWKSPGLVCVSEALSTGGGGWGCWQSARSAGAESVKGFPVSCSSYYNSPRDNPVVQALTQTELWMRNYMNKLTESGESY